MYHNFLWNEIINIILLLEVILLHFCLHNHRTPATPLSNFKLQQNSATVTMSLFKLQKKYKSLTFNNIPIEHWFFNWISFFWRKYDGISSDQLMSYSMIACFIEEKEQNKLDRRDPKILEQKRDGLLPNSDIKTMVKLN